MNPYLYLVAFFCKKDNYDRYYDKYNKKSLPKEIGKLLKWIGVYYDTYEKDVTHDFESWLLTVHCPFVKDDDREYYQGIITELANIDISTIDFSAIEQAIFERESLLELHSIVENALEKTNDVGLDEVCNFVDKIKRKEDKKIKKLWEQHVFNTPYEELMKKKEQEGKYTWRLKCLKNTIGKLPQQAFIVFGARPDSGKTSFLLSETLYLLPQMPKEKKLIFVQNEESAQRTEERMYHIVKADYPSRFANGKHMDISHRYHVLFKPDWHYLQLDAMFEKLADEIGMIVINTIDIVRGFSRGNDSSNVLALEAAYQWGRQVSLKYNCPVFIASQATEHNRKNKRILRYDDLYGSKTAKGGTADVVIMMAEIKENIAEENYRYLTVDKCKFSSKRLWGKRVLFNKDTGVFSDDVIL